MPGSIHSVLMLFSEQSYERLPLTTKAVAVVKHDGDGRVMGTMTMTVMRMRRMTITTMMETITTETMEVLVALQQTILRLNKSSSFCSCHSLSSLDTERKPGNLRFELPTTTTSKGEREPREQACPKLSISLYTPKPKPSTPKTCPKLPRPMSTTTQLCASGLGFRSFRF